MTWTDGWAEIPTDAALFEEHLLDFCRKENRKAQNSGSVDGPEKLNERWKVRW